MVILGKRRLYKLEEAVELLTNMSDCEDESTSESENEGDSSDSSEDAPEQHWVRTDSNILMPKETKVSKAKEIPKNGQKAAPKLVDNQSATKCALWLIKQPQHQVLHLQKYLKYLKPKKYPKRAKKLHQNWLIIRVPQSVLYWLIKQPQHQVLHLQKYLKYLKPKKYPKMAKKLHQNWLIIRVPQSVLYWLIKQPKLVDNQSATKCALLADQTATTSGASPAKVSKAKEIPKKGQKAAPKQVDNQSATKHALLADQTATTSGASPPKASKVSKAKEIPSQKLHQNKLIIRVPQSMLYWLNQTATKLGASPPKASKVSKAKEIPSQNAAPKLVDNQSATKVMASDSDIDVEDYYVIEDANESASSEYVPCINCANDKDYPEDVKNGWVKLEQDTGPPIFIGLRDPVATT